MFFVNLNAEVPRSPASGPEMWARIINLGAVPRGAARIAALANYVRGLEARLERGPADSDEEPDDDEPDYQMWANRFIVLAAEFAPTGAQRSADFEFDHVGIPLPMPLLMRLFYINGDLDGPRPPGFGPETWRRFVNLDGLPRGDPRVRALESYIRRVEALFGDETGMFRVCPVRILKRIGFGTKGSSILRRTSGRSSDGEYSISSTTSFESF